MLGSQQPRPASAPAKAPVGEVFAADTKGAGVAIGSAAVRTVKANDEPDNPPFLVTAEERLSLECLLRSGKPKDRSTSEFYSFGRVVGTGSFAKVRVCRHKLTGQVVAIKTYEKVISQNMIQGDHFSIFACDQAKVKDQASLRRIQTEIKLQERLDHPLVIRLFEAIESKSRIHLVMEYLAGGNLCT